jgi:hypothetical protein
MPITWDYAKQGLADVVPFEEMHEHSPVERRSGPGTGNPVVRVLRLTPAAVKAVPGLTLTDVQLAILGFATYTPGGARTLQRRLPMVDPGDMPFLGIRPARVATEVLAVHGVGSDGHSVFYGDPPAPGSPPPVFIRGQTFTNVDSCYQVTVRYQHVPFIWKFDSAVGAAYEAERFVTRVNQQSLEYWKENGAGFSIQPELGGPGVNFEGQPNTSFTIPQPMGSSGLGVPQPVGELTVTWKQVPASAIPFEALEKYRGSTNQAPITLTTSFGPITYGQNTLLFRGFSLVEDFFADGTPMADLVYRFGVRRSWLRIPDPGSGFLRIIQRIAGGKKFVPQAQFTELFRGPGTLIPPTP